MDANITNETSVSSITFTYTDITGNIYILISKTEKYPTESNFDIGSFGGVPIILNGSYYEDFSGNYYITVVGYETSYYSLRALITYKDNNGTVLDTYIQLEENKAETYTLTNENDTGLFEFKVEDIDDDRKDRIYVQINPSVGKYIIACDTNKTNLFENPVWKKKNKEYLIIKTDDLSFSIDGTYYCSVGLTDNSKNSY